MSSQNQLENKIQDILDQKYSLLSDEEKKEAHSIFFNSDTRNEIKNELKKIIFYIIPPTPSEFLSAESGFLPKPYIDSLYDYIKADFIEAMSSEKHYPIISIYGSTRTGKSVLARLFTIYTSIWVNYLRDPHTYYNISQMSRLCIYLVSFKDDKTKQIYLDPLLNILDASEKFKRERFELNVRKKGILSDGTIHFSEASKFGSITFPKMSIVTGRDASSLIGADIIAGAVSELTFFKQYVPGMTDEEVVEVFSKLSNRIQNTVGYNSFPCWTYIDSSANDASSPLEKLILDDLKNSPTTFFRWYILWKLRPHLFPRYHETGETFKVCTGSGDIPAKVINDIDELNQLPSHLIIDVPIDLKDIFKRDLINQIKDTAGYPTNNENKLIQDQNLIMNMFDNKIQNVEGLIIADAKDFPEELIWNLIWDKFFNKYNENSYIIKRAQKEPRYIGIDIAHALHGDIMGLCMLHKEWSKIRKQVIYVCDFIFGIKGDEKGISLEAPSYFIMNMLNKAGLAIKYTFTDTFQSEYLKQFMERNNSLVVKQSVDRILEPYQFLITCQNHNAIKCGKNIFLKNNLDSLYRIKSKTDREKIDHSKGTTNNNYLGDFYNSDCGKNAKDVSDALVQALWGASQDPYIPITYYEDEEEKHLPKKPEIVISDAFKKLHRFG